MIKNRNCMITKYVTIHFIFIEPPHTELPYWIYRIFPIILTLTLVLFVYMSYIDVVFYIRLENDPTVIILEIAYLHVCVKTHFRIVFCLFTLILKTTDQIMIYYPGEIWPCEYSILSNVLYKFNPSLEWQIMHVMECKYMNGVYWGSVININKVIIRQKVHIDIIVEMYCTCIEIDSNFLIYVHMILCYFIVIVPVLNMTCVGFAAHGSKQSYTSFSTIVRYHIKCKKSKSKKYCYHMYVNYPCPNDISILKCMLVVKIVNCYSLKYWCPRIINNSILVLSTQAIYMYTLTSFPFISLTTCRPTHDLILITLYFNIYYSFRINAINCNLFLVLSECVKVIYSITTSMLNLQYCSIDYHGGGQSICMILALLTGAVS